MGSRFFRFLTRSAWASWINPVAVSLKTWNFSNACVIRGRSLISTSNAGGIRFSAWVTTSRCPASVAASLFNAVMDAVMSSRWVASRPTKSFRRTRRSWIWVCRPLSAALNSVTISPTFPSPPPLTTTDSEDNVCSVDG